MKKLFTIVLNMGLCFTLSAQINSLPGGPYNWSSTSAWNGGVVPGPTDVVNIVMNSTVNLDVPVVHNADINILVGGVLTSPNPFNDLTINNANLVNSGQINFTLINAVPITINNGHYWGNASTMCSCGNFYILYTLIAGSSYNDGDLSVFGNLTIDGAENFNNNLFVSVLGDLIVNANCTMVNNLTCNPGTIINTGTFNNIGMVTVTDSVQNQIGSTINGTGNYLSIGSELNNYGTIIMNDSMYVATDLNNYGSMTNDSGIVEIQNNFYNTGTTSGSGNGQYNIAQNSDNTSSGSIAGDIDVCDATLLPATYLDVDNGAVDFNTVTFCTVSYAAIESVDANSLFDVYPNPSNGIYNLNNFENSSISILNTEGKIIFNQQILNTNTQIDLSELPAGIYFMQVLKDNNMYYSKLIKK